jgi:putative flippase GtrA
VVRFAVIGGASVATDLAVYALLVSSLDPAPAKGVSYLSGMLVGFVGNKFWSFKSARRTASEPITYVLLYAVTLAVNVLGNGGVLALTERWGLDLTVRRGLAFLVATGVTTVLNYLGLRWVTFRRGVAEREEAR